MSNPKSASRSIYIDQSSAELALDRLTKKMKSLEAEIAKGNLAGDKLNKKIKELDTTRSSVQAVQDQIAKGLRPTLVQTENQVRQLRNELKRMSEDAPGYAAKFESFKKATTELNRMQEAISGVDKAQRSWMQDAKTVAFGVLIGNTVQSALQAITGYLGGIVSGNAKLSDSLSDVEKATGLTSAEVAKLNGDLGKIDTRTATGQLREIAVGLGQLGEEANKANVEAIDKIVVALGDEFGGGAKEITTVLSVLRNNLQDIKTGDYGDDVTKIGNALNTLGAEGLATAPVVTDIANRIAGISQTFGLSSGQILGLAATFQELGIETERGSTAIVKLFQKIGAEPEKFSKITKLTAAEFKDLVNRDMLGAFEAVAKGAKEAGTNNVVFSQILKELDADGSGAGEVLSKLGTNADLLATKVNTASEALKNSDSITDEFAKKNTNLAAELEKLDKAFNALITSQTLSEAFAAGVKGLNAFIAALRAAPQWLKENSTGIYLIITGIAIMNASYIKAGAIIVKDTALRLISAATTKAGAIATVAATAAQSAYIVVTNFLTARITLATAAQRLWNIAMSLGAGPIGIIVVAIGALTIGITNLLGKTKQLTTEQRVQNELAAEILKITGEQESKAKSLFQALQQQNLSYDGKKKLLADLIALNPEYLKGLNLENINTAEGVKILDQYILKLREANKEKARQQLIDQKEKELSQFELTKSTLANASDKKGNLVKDVLSGLGLGEGSSGKQLIEAEKGISKLNDELKELYKTQAEGIAKTADQKTAPVVPGAGTNPFADNKAKVDEELKKAKARLKELGIEFNKLTQSAFAFEFAKIFEEKAEDEKLFKKKFSGDALKAALDQLNKTTEQRIIALNEKLQGDVKNKPVVVDVVPEITPEDEAALSASMARFLKKLEEPQRDEAAKRALAILTGTAKQRLDATIANLKDQEAVELSNTELLESEKELIREQYRIKRAEAEAAFLQKEMDNIQAVLSYAGDALNIFSQFDQARSNRENAALNRELKANDAKKAAFQRQLDSRIISQKQYDVEIAKLDKQAEAKKEALDKKQFERSKKIQIAQAFVNGAMGITSVLAARPGAADIFTLGAFRAINIAFTIASTAAQIANISSQKYAKGGVVNGATHADGGIKMVDSKSGRVVGEMEHNEPYMILSDNTYRNNKPVVDALLHSSMHNGGRRINPWWQTRSYQAINYPVINKTFTQQRMFAAGGVFNAPSDSASQQASGQDEEMKGIMNAVLYYLANPVAPKIERLQVDVPLKKIDDARAQEQRIQDDAAFR